VVRHGPKAIHKYFSDLPFGYFRHHKANMSFDVSPDAKTAVVSAYFLTDFPEGNQGGLYEVTFRKEAEHGWRISLLHVASTWGWHVGAGGKADILYFDPLAKGTLRGGSPVVWNKTLHPKR
jgi:hypothetical protein